MAKSSEDALQGLRDLLESLKERCAELGASIQTWDHYALVFNNASHIQRGHPFFSWLQNNYADATTLRVRRLLDKGRNAQSLPNLFRRLRAHQRLLTRTMHLEFYTDPDFEPHGQATFDALAGVGVDCYPLSRIDELEAELSKVPKVLRTYADKRVAHFEEKKRPTVPTFNDLRSSFDALEGVLHELNLLLNAVEVPSLIPTLQFDFDEIFTEPWVRP